MAVLRWLVFGLPLIVWAATSADQLFSQGQLAEKAGDLERAYSLYSQAAATKPKNANYWAKVNALRPTVNLMETSRMLLGGPGFAKMPEPDTNSDFLGALTDRDLEAARRPLPPVQVAASKE